MKTPEEIEALEAQYQSAKAKAEAAHAHWTTLDGEMRAAKQRSGEAFTVWWNAGREVAETYNALCAARDPRPEPETEP